MRNNEVMIYSCSMVSQYLQSSRYSFFGVIRFDLFSARKHLSGQVAVFYHDINLNTELFFGESGLSTKLTIIRHGLTDSIGLVLFAAGQERY